MESSHETAASITPSSWDELGAGCWFTAGSEIARTNKNPMPTPLIPGTLNFQSQSYASPLDTPDIMVKGGNTEISRHEITRPHLGDARNCHGIKSLAVSLLNARS